MKEKKIEKKVTDSFLTKKELKFLQERKSLKGIRKEREELEKEKKLAKEETTIGRIKKFISQPTKSFKPQNAKFIQTLQPAPALSREQDMLQELFNGEQTFGTGQNLPQMNGALTSGGGLINNGDDYGETGEMFGMRRSKSFGFLGGY
jgi:hypothetical protein